MNIIKLHDLYFKPYIQKDEISAIVKFLARQVKADLPKDEVPIFVGILNINLILFIYSFLSSYLAH